MLEHDRTLNAENALLELYGPPERIIPPEECVDGGLYWACSRSIGELVVCELDDSNLCKVAFKGWREKFGRDFISTEYHYDLSETFGTVRPLVLIGKLSARDDDALLSELLVEYIDFERTRITWLEGLPSYWKDLALWNDLLMQAEDALRALNQVSQEGFSAHPMPTFAEILAKAARRKEKDSIES
jgi:hypothetical protein